MSSSASARERLRAVGQADLGAWVEAADGSELWSIQSRIATALSRYRARVVVPSCTSSGKSFLAGRLALAFYDAYTPGTPCEACGGPCGGSKVITISSKFDQLRGVLWGEIRGALANLADKGLNVPGDASRGQNLRLDDGPNHFILGQSPSAAEGVQGFHGAHILVVGDEATALPEAVTRGLTSTLATGDARLLLIFNPTTPDTWAAEQSDTNRSEVIKIRAWDTPHFTGERVPPRSFLLTPETLDDMKADGRGPGSFDWVTKVEADFWTLGTDVLIPFSLYDQASATAHVPGTRALGIDLAPYGSDENTIAFRDGNALVRLNGYPSMRQDLFWQGPILDAVRSFAPDYLIWDADGVGAGVYGEAERVQGRYGGNLVLLPFRGGVSVTSKYVNARSAWWWNLRRRFEDHRIHIAVNDDKLRSQVTDIRYTITDTGDVKVETKKAMRTRGLESPDRGDSCLAPGTLVATYGGPVPVEHIRPGDLVWTRDGWRPVTWSWLTNPDAKRITVTLDDGTSVTGTPDHPVWTGTEFAPLGSLMPGCILPVLASLSRRTSRVKPVGAPSRAERRVVASDSEPPGPVFNLSVDGTPEFLLANGLLVHNCMYAFSMTDELRPPTAVTPEPLTQYTGVRDRSEAAMWRRNREQLERRDRRPSPWDVLLPGQDAWDD